MLGPIQALKGDRSGAEQMLSSATTLSKVGGAASGWAACGTGVLHAPAYPPDPGLTNPNPQAQGDLVCLVTSSRQLLRLFAGAPDDAARAAKQAAYTERKAGELAAAVAAAQATPAHAALLAWRPPRAG